VLASISHSAAARFLEAKEKAFVVMGFGGSSTRKPKEEFDLLIPSNAKAEKLDCERGVHGRLGSRRLSRKFAAQSSYYGG